MAATVLSIFICVMYLPYAVRSETSTRLELPPGGVGPESFAFETPGGNFYTGLQDDRIIKYYGSANYSWDVFAVTSPKWSKETCLESNDRDKGPICGRPLGLAYNPLDGNLYVADAFHGLLSLGSTGGIGIPLATSAEGQPFHFVEALDIDPSTGLLYFSDISSVNDQRDMGKLIETKDSTGRLMKYDPQTKEVTVLLRNLSAPGGVAVSRDGSSLFVSEYNGNRIQRFWLTRPKANTSEVIVSSIQIPDNIKRTPTGELLVAGATLDAQTLVPAKFTIDETGKILEVVSLGVQYGDTIISEIQLSGRNLYVGSWFTNFIGIYGP